MRTDVIPLLGAVIDYRNWQLAVSRFALSEDMWSLTRCILARTALPIVEGLVRVEKLWSRGLSEASSRSK
jgi:hypothetical protein